MTAKFDIPALVLLPTRIVFGLIRPKEHYTGD